jgi:hypothetical protein
MLIDLISEVPGAARALLVRAVPEKSRVPGDYDRMCRIASEKARVDFARRRIEMLEEARLLPPEIRHELVSLRERELIDYYKERSISTCGTRRRS